MAYVIGCILIIIALIILGLILRKKVYDEVDYLEGWKMDIMNRNVTSELARIKALNLLGETLEKFESWKERWDYILTKELPDIEEYLLDAEEAADRFKISIAKKNLYSVTRTLEEIEKEIDSMFTELDLLLDSEESSRKEIEVVLPKIKGLRKKMLQNRHLYGKAEVRFDVELDELEKDVKQYFVLAESGNYHEAMELVKQLNANVSFIEAQIQEFPSLYKKCKQELPSQIDDLLTGIKTMKEEGYRIDHLGFEKELYKHQEKLIETMEQLEKGSLSDSFERVFAVEERISEMYQILEKEATAREYVKTQLPSYTQLINGLLDELKDTNNEVSQLQETYYIEETDMQLHRSLNEWMEQLQNQFEQIKMEMEEEAVSHSQLKEQLENGYKELAHLKDSHDEFKEQVRTLRKDELEAKEQVLGIRRKLYDTHRKLQKSNIPGIPVRIWDLLEEATTKIEMVVTSLAKHPLDMGEVHQSLVDAKTSVQTMIDETELLLDQAQLVELVIQYANRYRSQDAVLSAKLSESEAMFRNYEYENALEEAVKALEEVEPGALRRLEEYSKVPS
ncbi:septation ring formation regulator EzrA [Aquibacillus salsiterrae]|uniref:Septation ring formation regulator EzrA n=1 Tax=Aquibacillus salsiterrae TaxID=2950439 RepID=A0A9X4AF80_9BACI|nr:septation ring formation regulator EzrA [Aquibacillus salsiterrae]MDC3415778.1 septation ring formation regulator EzrA [Aquibacillus salsiterrae]